MKTLEALESLEQNIEQQEKQIAAIYEQKANELSKSLMNELKTTLKRIESDIKRENRTVLENIDWELEKLRTRTKWTWLTGGIMLGIIIQAVATTIFK